MEQIAITGMGVISPLGNDVEKFWHDLLLGGYSGIGAIRRFDVSDLPTRIGGEINNFDPLDYMDKKSVKRTARFTQFGLAAAKQAFENAGLEITDQSRHEIGVYVGSSTCGLVEIEAMIQLGIETGYNRLPVITPIRDCNHAAAYTIACQHNITGPAITFTSACNASANAIEIALDQLMLSKVRTALVVGAEVISHHGFKALCLSGAMSTKHNHHPSKASRPFDRERDGFVVAEGAGAIILEKLSDAKKRGKKPHAVLAGCASTVDGFSVLKCEPEGRQISMAMVKALKHARINTDHVDYISAHGPSMPDTDRAETIAIKRTFKDHAFRLPTSSIKGAIGSPLGATNILQVIAASKSIENQAVPPTLNLETPDTDCDLDYVPEEPRDLKVNCALINSHAYGGGNASIVLTRL